MNLCKYIGRLINEGHCWQYKTIADNIENQVPKKHRLLPIQYCFLIISIIALFLFDSGVGSDFAGYIITALSVFIGLYISLLILLFDKFNATDFNIENRDQPYINALKRKRNFFLQFTALTSYSILVAILCIFLFSTSFLLKFNEPVKLWETLTLYISNFAEYKSFSLSNFILVIKLLVRLCSIYFLLDFFFFLLFAVSSMYSYMSKEYKDQEFS